MNTRRIMTAAITLALVISAIAVMTASAAQSQKGPTKFTATKNFQTKVARTSDFAASPKNLKATGKPVNTHKYLPNKAQLKSTKALTTTLNIPVVAGVTPTNLNPKLVGAVNGLNSYDNAGVNGFDLTPPDQALCIGNGYGMEGVNLVLKVYNPDGTGYSKDIAINSAFALDPSVFTSDPKCYYDADTQRWFVTILAIFPDNTSALEMAVSRFSNPNLGWDLYSINTTDDGSAGTITNNEGCPCFGDQPLLGASKDALFVTTNEYSLVNAWPVGYNGSQVYAFDKLGLANGFNGSLINAVYFDIGLNDPTPDGACNDTNDPAGTRGFWCWYSLQPTTAPSSLYDNTNGGTEWLLSSLDFWNQYYAQPGSLDNRITVWDFENLSSLHSFAPDVTGNLQTITTETYGGPQNAVQKTGPIPLGDNDYAAGGVVGAVATNDDRMNQTVYASGLVWGAVNTIIKTGNTQATHTGTAWFGFTPHPAGGGLASLNGDAYIGAIGEDLAFPSIAVLPTGSAIIANILTGADYYPSMAYSLKTGLTFNNIHVAAMGQSPIDDFCEYDTRCGGGVVRPRAGDYTAAVAFNGKFYIATEGVQFANCSDSAWAIDPSCGGTRSEGVNWGTFLGEVKP